MRRPLILQSISRRLPSSIALLLAGVLAVGGTALAPLWERSIEQRSLRTELTTASDDQTRLTVQASNEATRAVYRDTVVQRLTRIASNPAADAHFGPVHGSVVMSARLGVSGPAGTIRSTRLGWLPDGCTRLQIPLDACPTERDQVAVSQADATALGVAVGDTLTVRRQDGTPTPSLAVTAIWTADAAAADFGTDLGDPALPDGVSTVPLATDPLLVSTFQLETVYGDYGQVARVVRHLDPATVDVDSMDAVRSAVADAEQAALDEADSDFVSSNVDRVLARVDAERRTSQVIVGLAAIQLLAVSLVGLGVLVRAISTARAPEFAVGSLRGLSTWQVARSAVGTTVVLLVVAVPVGWLAAIGVGRAAAAIVLGSGTSIEPLRWPVAAAVAVAFLGGVVTAVVAAARAVRTPVASLLHRSAATDDRGRIGAAVEVASVAVAAIAAFQLVRGGALQDTGQSGLGLVAPALVAVGAGVVLARIATLVLHRGARRSPRRPATLLARRRLAHAPGVLRGAVVLVAGAALAASAVDLAGIAARNRHLRAGQEVGAAAVLTVQVDPGVDLRSAVDAGDPSGRVAMAAVQRTDVETGVRVVAVDTDRYAAVASVEPGWTGLSASEIPGRLRPPTAPPFPVTGTSLTVDVADVRIRPIDPDGVSDGSEEILPEGAGIDVATDLLAIVDDGRSWQEVTLGSLTAPTQELIADLPASCATDCSLVGLRLDTELVKATFVAQFTVVGIGTDTRPPAASFTTLTRADSWIAPTPTGSDSYSIPSARVGAREDGLHLSLSDPVGSPGDGPEVLVATRPATLPVIAGTGFGQFPLALAAPALLGTGLDGEDAAFLVQGESQALPRVGPPGVLVDLRVALAACDPSQLTDDVFQVWVSRPSEVPALSRDLAGRGVRVVAVETAAARERELASLGPARAVVVAEIGAAAALVLALLVALAGLLAAGRNRLYELASLRAAGVRDRTLRRGVLVELGGLLGVAAVLGLGVGLGVAGLTTAGFSFYADGGGPPLDLAPDLLGVGALALAAVVTVGVVALVTGVVLVRAAGPSRLRESIR